MGRLLMYTTLAALATVVLAAAFLLQRGGGSTQAAAEISVHDLSTDFQTHAGQRVSTEGVLRRIQEPEEHFLVTADGLGVVVRGYSADVLRALDGKTVAVVGRFAFDPPNGIYIQAETVTPLQ